MRVRVGSLLLVAVGTLTASVPSARAQAFGDVLTVSPEVSTGVIVMNNDTGGIVYGGVGATLGLGSSADLLFEIRARLGLPHQVDEWQPFLLTGGLRFGLGDWVQLHTASGMQALDLADPLWTMVLGGGVRIGRRLGWGVTIEASYGLGIGDRATRQEAIHDEPARTVEVALRLDYTV
jgi:hypothetical protein